MPKRIPTGSVFQKSYRDRNGKLCKTATWHLRYYRLGKVKEVASGTENYDEALQLLRKKMAERPTENADSPDRVRMAQLFELLLEDYRYKNRKSTYDTEKRVAAHLLPFFKERKAQAITTSVLKLFVDRRRREGAEPATINKELSWVRRAMKLGARHEPPLVLRVPAFDMLPLDNVREGTIEHDHYRTVRDNLPPYARIALVIAYHTGARKGEICSIRTDYVDTGAKRIFRPGRTTKNGRPRYLPIYGDMAAELEMAIATADRSCPFLIQRNGQRVFDFEKAWATACEAAGIKQALFHDLRRTALTNMIEAGLSEKEAMEISGHRTRAVFDRYHIVSDRRMKQNAEKLGAHLKGKENLSRDPSMGKDNGERQNGRLN
jgi:integrase